MSSPGFSAPALPAQEGASPSEASLLGDDALPVPAAKQSSRARLFASVILVLLGFFGLFLLGYLPKRAQRERLEASAGEQERAARGVAVVKPKRIEQKRLIKLTAALDAHEQAVVHARASGYVRRCLVDIGSRVQAGQLLAELDTPELDRELEQARARLSESEAAITLARASRDFSGSSLERYAVLSERKLTSKLELERLQSEVQVNDAKLQVAEASRASQLASLKRLEQLKAFARVLAPFAGTITSRSIATGQLVTAGVASPLFEVASLDPLRVAVDVPQSLSLAVHAGDAAKLALAEYPTRPFEARIARTAGRLDPKTHMLRVELEVPNPSGQLLPGMYAKVELGLESSHELYTVPATALLINKDGTKVALVERDGRVRFAPVVVERDNGAEVELASGLDGSEQLVSNPGMNLREGSVVTPQS